MFQLPFNLLWAIDRSRWDDIASGMKPRAMATGDLLWVIGVLLTAGLLLWLVLKWLSGRDKGELLNSPFRLFVELCRGHKLTWREGWLLWQVAAAQRLRQPAMLFLEPERLNPVNLPDKLQAKAAVLDGLRERLFAEEEPEAAKDTPGPDSSAQVPAPAAG